MDVVHYWLAILTTFALKLKIEAQEIFFTNQTYDSPILFIHQPESVTYCSPLSTCFLRWEVDLSGEEILIQSFEKDDQPFNHNEFINGTSIVFKEFSIEFVGTYACIFSFGNKVLRSAKVILKAIRDIVTLDIYPHSVRLNEAVILSCWEETLQYSSFHIYAIKWYKDSKRLLFDNKVQAIGKNKLLIQKVQVDDHGYYECSVQVTKYNNERKSHTKLLNVTDSNESLVTTIVYKTSDQVVKANSTITIECLARHSNLMHIVKEVNGKLQVLYTTLGNFANYTIQIFDSSNTGIYLCEAIGQHIAREYIRLDIGVQPISNENGFVENVPVLIGYSAVMSCKSSGFFNATVSWFKNGSRLDLENLPKDFIITTSSLSKYNIDNSDLDFYQCIVENAFGSYSKYFHLYLTYLVSGVQSLKVAEVTSTHISFSWLPPLIPRTPYFRYVYSWTSDVLKGRAISTEKNTSERSVIVESEVFGGIRYKIGVCLFYRDHDQPESCVYTFAITPESYPKKGPQITSLGAETGRTDTEKELCSAYLCLRVTWINQQWFSNGRVRFFTLNALSVVTPFEKTTLNITSRFTYDYLTSDMNETLAVVNNQNLIKIWMTSTTSIGVGPMSNSFLVSKNSLWDKDVYKREASVNWDSPYDQKESDAVIEWKHDYFYSKDQVIVGWLIYYIPIPFSNYWRSVNKKRYSKDISSATLYNLNNTIPHRITIAAILAEKLELRIQEVLGNVTHLILGKNENAKSKRFHIRSKKEIIQPPTSLKCVSISSNEILVSWSNPPATRKILSYNVYIYNETNIRSKVHYQTTDHYLRISNLQPYVFYMVRVIPKSEPEDTNTLFLPSEYISCQTQIQVPSMVEQADYYFVQKNIDGSYRIYLIVRWQEPNFIGDGIYNYKIYLQPYTQKHITHYPFERETYHTIVNGSTNGWIYSPSIIVHPNTYFEITIIPVNGAGEGKPFILKTRGLDVPIKISQTSSLVTLTQENSSHLSTGIIIGLSVAAFFMFILVVIFILKNPCKSLRHYEKRIVKATTKQALYLKRFDEQNSASSSTACQGCGGVCTANIYDNPKSTISKFIMPFWRLLERPMQSRNHHRGLTQPNQPLLPDSKYDVRSMQFSTSSVSFKKTGDSLSSNQRRDLISTSRS